MIVRACIFIKQFSLEFDQLRNVFLRCVEIVTEILTSAYLLARARRHTLQDLDHCLTTIIVLLVLPIGILSQLYICQRELMSSSKASRITNAYAIIAPASCSVLTMS